MFEQNYGSKDARWLYWFMGVIAVYVLMWMFPATERYAPMVAIVLGVIGALLFHRAMLAWIREKLQGH
jgi:uncharacterized membrane protein YdcZ (DUF606 family)